MSTTETGQVQQKWEYMELTRKTEGYLVNELNDLGQAGWELVSVSFQKDVKSGLGSGSSWIAFLKRPCLGELRKLPTSEKTRDVAAPASKTTAKLDAEDAADIFGIEE